MIKEILEILLENFGSPTWCILAHECVCKAYEIDLQVLGDFQQFSLIFNNFDFEI